MNFIVEIFAEKSRLNLIFTILILISGFQFAQTGSIVIISPNGNEKLQINTRQGISWISKNVKNIDIYYSIDNGNSWKEIAQDIDANLGVFAWNVPNLIGENALIKIASHNNKNLFDISDYQFTFSSSFTIKGNLLKSNKVNSPTVIMPLGNSITYDNRVNDPRPVGDKAGYRDHLYELLTNAGINFSFTGSEHSGGNILPAGFDANAGFPGITDDQLLYLLKTGWRKQPQHGINEQITVGPYLNTYPANIILLHIGTNGNNKPDGTLAVDVENILNHIDSISTATTVVLARIIDRAPPKNFVTQFNDNVENMALDRVNNPSNPAYPDKIIIVDMQNNAGFDYTIDSMGTIGDGKPGDMNDMYHPNAKGYYKMAELWFQALSSILISSPAITNQPKDVSAIEGQPVIFSVKANGTKPFTYQWKKNGIDITGATDSVYQISSVTQADDSSHYSCVVSNTNKSVTSNDAILYVAGQNERVKANLQVLYNFENKNNISDLSNEGSPLNLIIDDPANVESVPYGLNVAAPTSIYANSSPTKIYNSCLNSNEITIEAWVKPESISQTGPARIITFSKDGSKRNFTLAQENDKYLVRLNTTTNDDNGQPALFSSSGSLTTELTHVVYTKDSLGNGKIYINGFVNLSNTLNGNFSSWDSTYSFGLANEFSTDRTWLGTFYLAAIYNRALRLDEIEHNYLVKFNGFPKLLFKPTELNGTVKNDSLVMLTWKDNEENELGYIVERKANLPDSSYFVLDTLLMDAQTFIDFTPKHSTSYIYRVRAYNDDFISDYSDTIKVDNIISDVKRNVLSHTLRLFQNYPNPFNPATTIKYAIPPSVKTLGTKSQPVELKVFDVLGREVTTLVNEIKQPGYYEVKFDAGNLSSGIYYYQLKVGGFVETKKMILMQ